MPSQDTTSATHVIDLPGLRTLARELGFQDLGVAGVDLARDEAWLERWLALGRHGEMRWMARHGRKRSRPDELVPGTLSILSVRMDYWRGDPRATALLDAGRTGYVSRYALGRDYHKVLRRRLQKLADRITGIAGPFGYRAFVDSGPVLEKALARNAGLGWIGKHTNLIHRDAGSWFFLGELLTDLPLSAGEPAADHCGSCTACLEVCPTRAIVAPYELDARRCISYLTIEHPGAIDEKFRAAIGNRIYGCDDCQLFCPWNKFARPSPLPDWAPRNGLDAPDLVGLFAWTRAEFLSRTEGTPIRRIGFERWSRNIAIALGNAPPEPDVRAALERRRDDPSPIVREHVQWALARPEVTKPASRNPCRASDLRGKSRKNRT
jgi:epoxyqueuosine reductase